jgi:hypothetical protein
MEYKSRIFLFNDFFGNGDDILESTKGVTGPQRPLSIYSLLPIKYKTAYDNLAISIAKEKKIDKKKIDEVLNKIAFHETGKTLDPKQKQVGGPGRGLYQYEIESLKTAVNRVFNFCKKRGERIPAWIEGIKKDWDITKLTSKQQSYIALIDMLERKNFDLMKAIQSDKELVEQWGKGWQTKNDPQKKKKFLSEIPLYYQAKKLNKIKYLN